MIKSDDQKLLHKNNIWNFLLKNLTTEEVEKCRLAFNKKSVNFTASEAKLWVLMTDGNGLFDEWQINFLMKYISVEKRCHKLNANDIDKKKYLEKELETMNIDSEHIFNQEYSNVLEK